MSTGMGTTAKLCLIAAMLLVPNWLPAAEDAALLGRWRVEKVVYGGQELPDLQGTITTFLEGGRKTFEIRPGQVEKGTYRLTTGSPLRIDTTTDGKKEKPIGIYRVEGDTLTMVFSQTGRKRPTDFTSKQRTDHLLMVLKRDANVPPPTPPSLSQSPARSFQVPTQRCFYMGFTAFPHDMTLEAAVETQSFVKANADIIAHHIEGVPWEAMHEDKDLPDALLEELRGKQGMTPPKAQVFLAISPGRGELKGHDKAPQIPTALRGKPYHHELVKQAYLRYCQRMVKFFRPNFLAIGIEVNEIYDPSHPQRWLDYVELHRYVYEQLKREYPQMPIFASMTLHTMLSRQGKMLEAFQGLMPYNDIIGVSYYPFFVEPPQRSEAFAWLLQQFQRFEKPFAMAETNDTAEPTTFDSYTLVGDANSQSQYYQELFQVAEENHFLFVIAFVHRDYDALWDKIQAFSPGLFKAWMNCGFLDEQGNARPSLAVWKQYFALPWHQAE